MLYRLTVEESRGSVADGTDQHHRRGHSEEHRRPTDFGPLLSGVGYEEHAVARLQRIDRNRLETRVWMPEDIRSQGYLLFPDWSLGRSGNRFPQCNRGSKRGLLLYYLVR